MAPMNHRRPDDVAPEELVRGEPREAQVELLLDEPPQALVAVDDAQQQLPQPRRVADDERVAAPRVHGRRERRGVPRQLRHRPPLYSDESDEVFGSGIDACVPASMPCGMPA